MNECKDWVSIPRGAVKSCGVPRMTPLFARFQFQEVQLKGKFYVRHEGFVGLFQFQEVQLKGRCEA